MSKFKVGDKVVRLVSRNSEKFVDLHGVKDYYTITNTSRQGYWLQVDGVHNKEDQLPWYWANFELYQEPGDDGLPPAPKRVRYYHTGYCGVDSRVYLDVHSGSFASGPRIRLTTQDNLGVTIDADAALQLAHDLRRMAMDIKRKEKANV